MWQIINTYICAFIMLLGVLIFGRLVLNEQIKINLKKFLVFFEVICILQTLTGLVLDETLKTLLIFLMNMLFYKYTFKITVSKSIFLIFLYMILLLIPDALELFFLTKVLNMSSSFCYEIVANSILSNIIIVILATIITIILKKKFRKLINIKIEANIKLILYYILTFICISILFYKAFGNIKINLNFLVTIFVIVVFLIILFSLIKQTIENNNITRKYDKLLEFMVTYENEIEKQRILRHEVKNEFRTIRAKICDKQKEKEIIEYIDEIVNDKYEVHQEQYAKFGYLPANGIKGLCYFKVQEAEEKGITVSLNISKRIKNSILFHLDVKQQRDFGKILGVFLDNAIEASLESSEKKLGFEAYMSIENEVKIIISNTYDNKIDKEKIGKESYSTKGQNRGHGLLLVKRITENNELFETSTSIQNNIYSQIITVRNKKDC